MAAFAALRIWFELAYDYLVVQGRSGMVLIIQSCSFAVSLPLMLLAVQHNGQSGVAAAQFLVGLVVVAPLYLFSLGRVGIDPGPVVRAVLPPVISGVLVWLAARAIAGVVSGPFVAAAAAGVIAVLVIAALTGWQRDTVRLLRGAVSKPTAS